MDLMIGIDFDNTIVSYDTLASQIVVEWGLFDPGMVMNVKQIRTRLRAMVGGEERWQDLQAAMYGHRIGEAVATNGLTAFLRKCAEKNARLAIVSHKTLHAARDASRVNLQSSALNWLKDKGLLDPGRYGLQESAVHFEPTPASKARRVAEIGCTHFIDDNPLVFMESDFPETAEKILFSPGGEEEVPDGVIETRNWAEIASRIFA